MDKVLQNLKQLRNPILSSYETESQDHVSYKDLISKMINAPIAAYQLNQLYVASYSQETTLRVLDLTARIQIDRVSRGRRTRKFNCHVHDVAMYIKWLARVTHTGRKTRRERSRRETLRWIKGK